METYFEKTRRLLRERRGSYPEIAEETGLGIEWMQKVSQGVIRGEAVDRIERLRNYLEASDEVEKG